MKKTLLLLLLSLPFYSLLGQEMTLKNLIEHCNRERVQEIHSIIGKGNWFVFWDERDQVKGYSQTSWTYGEDLVREDGLIALFSVHARDGIPQFIEYNVNDEGIYKRLSESIFKSDFQLDSSGIEHGAKFFEYSNATSIAKIKMHEEESQSGITSKKNWTFTLAKKYGTYNKLNGLKKEYDQERNVAAEYTLVNGLVDGIVKTYYSNGKLEREGTYLKGVENGYQKTFDELGQLETEYFVQGGELHGLLKEYKDSKLIKKSNWKNGFEDGERVEYFYHSDDGRLKGRKVNEIVSFKKEGDEFVYLVGNDGVERFVAFSTYKEGVQSGPFQYCVGDTIFVGSYDNDAYQGPYQLYLDVNASKRTTIYKGDFTKLILLEKGNFERGYPHGLCTRYYSNGALRWTGSFSYGKKEGIWKTFHETTGVVPGANREEHATMATLATYRKGKLNGPYESMDFRKKMIESGSYVDDEKEGLWIERVPTTKDNITYREGTYRGGVLVGKWSNVKN